MAIPVCLELPDIPSPQEIILPGGASLASLHADLNSIPNTCTMSLNLMAQVGPALAPLKPFFDLLDTVISLFNCFKAIPQSVLTLNPEPLLSCIPEVAEKVAQLLKLIPQLSIPLAIISIIRNVIAFLTCMVTTIENLIGQAQAIAERLERASQINDAQLNAILECAQQDVDKMQMNATEALAGLGTLIGVINIFLGIIGAPTIPLELPVTPDIPLEEMIAPLRKLVKGLEDIINLIPVP